jgi:hypothetical protein
MAELLRAGPPDGPWRLPRWVVVLGVAVVVAGLVAVVVWRLGDSSPASTPPAISPSAGTLPTSTPTAAAFTCPRPPIGPSAAPFPAGPVTALTLSADSPGTSLDRWDKTARSGPWAVVVRRRGGSLARQSAVITFPAPRARSGHKVSRGHVAGVASPGVITWPIDGAHARIRGDVGQSELLRLAAATRITAGRPVVDPPAGFTVVNEGSYRPTHVREVRYDGGGIAGLVYTGVTSLAGFEDQLLTATATFCGTVHGQLAVVSGVGGGNETLAWQLTPALVGYVGFSGGDTNAFGVSALHQLADDSRTISQRQWLATKPQVVAQRNT